MKNKYMIFLACCFFYLPVFAQEDASSASPEPFKKTHSVSLVIGHAHISEGRDSEGNPKMLAVPMWGLGYIFQFSKKWAIGLHTDFTIETFEVEKHLESGEEEVVERTKPVAPALMVIYKPTPHWSFGWGIGGEFAKEEDYALGRLGVEYGAEIRKGWEVFGGLQYDFRVDAYDTWTIGLGLSKALGKRKKEE